MIRSTEQVKIVKEDECLSILCYFGQRSLYVYRQEVSRNPTQPYLLRELDKTVAHSMPGGRVGSLSEARADIAEYFENQIVTQERRIGLRRRPR